MNHGVPPSHLKLRIPPCSELPCPLSSLRPDTSSSHPVPVGNMISTLPGAGVARLRGAGETGMAFRGYGDGSDMGKPIPGQGMACRNVHPWQVCAQACVSGCCLQGQGEIPTPGLPPAPCPYIAVPALPELQGWGQSPLLLYTCGEPAASWAWADSCRILLSSQPESAVGLGSLPWSSVSRCAARNITLLFAKSMGSWQASVWPILN